MPVTQEEEKKIECQDKSEHLNQGPLDERRPGSGHPDGHRLDRFREILTLHPAGERLKTRMTLKRSPPLAGFDLSLDEFGAFCRFLDKSLPHKCRGNDHDEANHHDGDCRGQVGALELCLERAVDWIEQHDQRQRPGERGQERVGHPVTEIDSDGGHPHQHQCVDMTAGAPVVRTCGSRWFPL